MTTTTVRLTRGYTIELVDEEDGTWTALVPDLPGCVAAGETPTDALEAVGEAIDAWIASARADGAVVPAPARVEDEYSGRFVVRVPKSLHRALAQRATREGVSLNAYCVTALTQVTTQGLMEARFVRATADRYVHALVQTHGTIGVRRVLRVDDPRDQALSGGFARFIGPTGRSQVQVFTLPATVVAGEKGALA